MAAITLSTIFKIIQADGTDIEDVYRKSPMMASITHKKGLSAEKISWRVAYSGLGGGSYSASQAESLDVNSEFLPFSVAPKTVSSYRSIPGLATRMALAGEPSTEYIDIVKAEMKTGIKTVFSQVATNAFRSTTNTIGQRATASTNVITLTKKSDVYLINKGDVVGASATDGGTARVGSTTVVAKDPSAGTITLASAAAIASFADNDFLFIVGNQNAGMAGLGAYNPATAPTSGDAVFGGDRSVDPEATAGIRYTTGGTTKREDLIKFMAYMEQTPGFEASPGNVYCHSNDVADLMVDLEATRFTTDDNEYKISISKLRCGNAVLVTDPFAVPGEFRYVPKSAEFEFHSVNGFDIDSTDGNEMVRKSGDNFQLVARVDGNFVCKHPGQLGMGSW
jgi:hypothetical protein